MAVLVFVSCTPESSKLCTYISSHGDSVVDYFAIPTDLLHQATRVVVDRRVESEHMPVKLSWLTIEAHNPQAATETSQSQITKMVWDPHKEEMVKSELSSVDQLIKEDLNHSVEMFNSALKETATVKTNTVRCGPSQTIKCPGLIMNAGHKSVKVVRPCVRQEEKNDQK